MKKTIFLFLAILLLITACSSENGMDSESKDTETKKGIVSHQGEPISGGIFQVGLSGEQSFQGLFSYLYEETPMDGKIMEKTMYGSLERGRDLQYMTSEVLSFEPDPDKNRLIMKILSDKYKWSDGTPVISKDFEYGYRIIGSGEYTGLKYDESFENIIGMKEYREGEADSISGIEIPDDQTIIIYYEEFKPDILWGEGVLTEPVPSKQMEEISIGELGNSEVIRVNPLSVGPFVITQVIPSEKVIFTANEHFWGGKPTVEGVEFSWIKPIETIAALNEGRFDYVESLDPTLFEQASELNNYSVLKKEDLTYTYLGFKLGDRVDEDGRNVIVPNPESKMANQNLRTAMAYAIDREKVAEEYFRDLRYPGNSLVLPIYRSLSPENPTGFPFDTNNANNLLTQEGYVDVDGDEIREDPNGETFVISFAIVEDGYLAKELAEFYIQSWKAIGLNVTLVEDRPLQMQELYTRLQGEDSGIDVFQGTWGMTVNPNPTPYYSKYSEYNYAGFTTEALEENLQDISSSSVFSESNRLKQYSVFHEIMTKEAAIIPFYYRDQFSVVNRRVDHFEDRHPDGETRNWRWNQIILNRESPMV